MTTIDDARAKILISARELAELISTGKNPILLDVRFIPDGDGRADYRAGHISGAIYVDLPTELAGEQRLHSGRGPLPDIRDLQRDARRWGIDQDSAVVVYDGVRGLRAGRAWWVLRWAGIRNVRLLDGGLDAWEAAGYGLATEIPLPRLGNVVLEPGNLATASADRAAELARSSVLLDARALDQYIGSETDPGRPALGHIPGAVSAPTTGNLDSSGLIAQAAELRARFAALGVDGSRPVAIYCGGGVAAAHQILALATIGIDAALFPGSWSAWSSDPRRPVAIGSEPG